MMRKGIDVLGIIGAVILVAGVVCANIWCGFYVKTALATFTALYIVIFVAWFMAKN